MDRGRAAVKARSRAAPPDHRANPRHHRHGTRRSRREWEKPHQPRRLDDFKVLPELIRRRSRQRHPRFRPGGTAGGPDAELGGNRLPGELAALFPAFKGMKVAETWAGLMDVTPDAVPVIGPVDALPGFFIATGFSGHGFGIGPAIGEMAAQLATGATPMVDPGAFRLARFQ